MIELSKELEAYIDKLVHERVAAKVPHICIYCERFQFSQTKKTNRYCQYKGELRLERNICQMWILAEDVGLRVRGNYTV